MTEINRLNFFFFNFFFFLMIFFSAYILFMYVCMYVCMAVLGLRFCARAFPSCGKRGPLPIAVRGPPTTAASRCRAQAPDAQAQQPWPTGRVAPRHAGSSQTRARTRVPRTGGQTLHHCATREARTLCLIPCCPYVPVSELQFSPL